MSDTRWIGIDPGAKQTGIVLRHDDTPVRWVVVERPQGHRDAVYLTFVVGLVQGFERDAPNAQLVIEDIVPPGAYFGGKRQMLNPASAIATAKVFGAVVAMFGARVLAPAGFGSGPRGAYPAELWGAREGASGTGKLRHVRSAWDLTLAAERALTKEAS